MVMSATAASSAYRDDRAINPSYQSLAIMRSNALEILLMRLPFDVRGALRTTRPTNYFAGASAAFFSCVGTGAKNFNDSPSTFALTP